MVLFYAIGHRKREWMGCQAPKEDFFRARFAHRDLEQRRMAERQKAFGQRHLAELGAAGAFADEAIPVLSGYHRAYYINYCARRFFVDRPEKIE